MRNMYQIISYWNPIGNLLEPYWNPIGTLLEPYCTKWNPIGTLLEPYCTKWNPIGTLLQTQHVMRRSHEILYNIAL